MMKKLLALDVRLTARLRMDEAPAPLRRLAILLAHSGDSWFWLVGLAFVWLLGNAAWKFVALVLVLGVVGTALLVLAIKFTVKRQRPAGEWGRVYRTSDPHSFPSGHAARAMMLAIAAILIAPQWLGILLLGWAPCVGLARVAMGVHYLSDVVAGLLVGGLLGAAVGLWLPLMVK
ncbi:MAG: phosphatase PAP2 family protein [Chloroflexota bacterium]